MKDTGEVLSATRRMVRALGRRVNDPDELLMFVQLRDELDEAMAGAVAHLRTAGPGYTDSDIGRVLGMTRQGVRWKWPHVDARTGAGARYRKPNDGRTER